MQICVSTSSWRSGTHGWAGSIGQGNGVDLAIVKLSLGSFDVSALSTDLYAGGMRAKIHVEPISTLSGHPEVLGIGWAGGVLLDGFTRIPSGQAFNGWYRTAAGTGNACQGDSGGPDWAWINNTELPGWRLIGIHSVGGDCAVDMSTSMGTAEFRDWIISCAGNDQCD